MSIFSTGVVVKKGCIGRGGKEFVRQRGSMAVRSHPINTTADEGSQKLFHDRRMAWSKTRS